MIPYGRQAITKEDIIQVNDILKSNFLTQGPTVPNFEKKLADITLAKYVTATSNATAALHLACLALGVKEDDLVWTVPNTFVASANAFLNGSAGFSLLCINALR